MMEYHRFSGVRIPVATYRLQFNREFGFAAAREIVSYLHDLGITDIYASPYFRARPGSMHGYDIHDQNALNPEIGSVDEYDLLVAELRRHGMGQILDIVPNHMCIEGSGNERWQDLLENGPSSLYANFFDIDWQPVKRELTDKILFPILGNQYGTVLESGELVLGFAEGAFSVNYYEHRLPVMPKSYTLILAHRIEELEAELGTDHVNYQDLLSIITALKHLPPYTERDAEKVVERYREKEVIKRRLAALYDENPAIAAFIDRNVALFNGEKGNPASFDLLDALLREQVHRVSHWRVATEEINYRRFFDINALAAIRMEDPAVFEETHRLLFSLVRSGKVTGLRVDHADGLYDPCGYLRRLQRGCFLQICLGALHGEDKNAEAEEELAAQVMANYDRLLAIDPNFKPFYIVSEKILIKGERLPEEWPVYGTTGYSFANLVNGLFVDGNGVKAIDAIWSRFTRARPFFPDVVYEKKKLVMQVAMSGEVNTLAHYLSSIAETNRHTRDFTLNSLIKALVEIIAFFPVYRTYTSSSEVAERDRQYVDYAVGKARRQNPALDASVFGFIRDALLLRFYEGTGDADRRKWLDFVMRFQQITGPVMAKGAEDTAFYVYNRLVSLNEVGGSPDRFGIPLAAFHGQNLERSKTYPHTLIATSTHDTKRSEDVRARITVLSEIPGKWRDGLSRWRRLNRKRKIVVDGQPAPDRNEEYLLYQTLVGTWPLGAGEEEWEEFRRRIREYMLKALREAKVNSSWISPNTAYEDAVLYFVDALLNPSPANQFFADFAAFQQTTASCGMFNSLSQTFLKIASPGVPDFYQGTELWDFSLVDPDNRRLVDYRLRRELLAGLREAEAETGVLSLARELVRARRDGRIKLFLVRKALNFRRERRHLFDEGKYLPLAATGTCADHVCAFERCHGEASALAIVPRFLTRLIDETEDAPVGSAVWQDTRLLVPLENAGTSYRNAFTGEVITVDSRSGETGLLLSEVLATFPVALLEKISGEPRETAAPG